eukprot:scaffold79785_cov32-Tisochrysis_lutea.AAC.1
MERPSAHWTGEGNFLRSAAHGREVPIGRRDAVLERRVEARRSSVILFGISEVPKLKPLTLPPRVRCTLATALTLSPSVTEPREGASRWWCSSTHDRRGRNLFWSGAIETGGERESESREPVTPSRENKQEGFYKKNHGRLLPRWFSSVSRFCTLIDEHRTDGGRSRKK